MKGGIITGRLKTFPRFSDGLCHTSSKNRRPQAYNPPVYGAAAG
ncbi:hypothetical protein [Neisseria elongata]|nr:hypothetical protein [Neisseria elongata]